MKKVNEYDKMQIEQGLSNLQNNLFASINDMLSDEDYVEFDYPIGTASEYITSVTVYYDEDGTVENIEARREYTDDGLLYSDDIEISELPINILYGLWEYLKSE